MPDAPLIIFSHANSFPASTYGVLFRSLRGRGFRVKALEKFGHDPHYPVTSNWPHLVRQLAAFAEHEAAQHTGPVFLAGHSLGGFLSVMCAALHPDLAGRPVAGVLMLDSPLLGGWRARALELAKRTQLVGSLSPGKISRQRRNLWPDQSSVLTHFQGKKIFSRWDPQVLHDYVEHGTHDVMGPDGKTLRALSFDRDVETVIYNTLPHNLDRLLKRHPLRCPVAFIGGTHSAEMRQVGMTMTRKVIGADHSERLLMIGGSHLFPMEKPLETAAAMERALRSFL